jgi:hypothetical protein
MRTLKQANLAFRFFLELAAWAALAYWGWQVGDGPLGKAELIIGALLASIALWSLFGAPRAPRHLGQPWRLLLEIVVFGSAVPALIAAGQPGWALVLGVLLVVNEILLVLWKQ